MFRTSLHEDYASIPVLESSRTNIKYQAPGESISTLIIYYDAL